MTDAQAEDRPLPTEPAAANPPADAPSAAPAAGPQSPPSAPDPPPAAADSPPAPGLARESASPPSLPPAAGEPKSRSGGRAALLAGGYALLVLLLLQPISDPWLLFHLRIGEMIRGDWSTRRLGPTPSGVGARPHPKPQNPLQPNLADPFSVRRFAAKQIGATGRLDPKLHWHPPSWGYDRILAEVFVWGGWTGVVGLRVVAALLAAFALERLLARRRGPPTAAAGILFLILLAAPEIWREGPSCWGLWLSLLALDAGWRWSEGRPEAKDLALPALFAFWTQLEPTTWVGLASLGWGAVWGAAALFPGDAPASATRRNGLMAIVLVLCTAACLWAPGGGDVWKSTLDSAARWQASFRFPHLAADKLQGVHLVGWIVLLAAAAGATWLAGKEGRGRRGSLLVLAALGPLLTGDGAGWAAACCGAALLDAYARSAAASAPALLAAWPPTRGAAFAILALGLAFGGTRLPWNVCPIDRLAIPTDGSPRLAMEFLRDAVKLSSTLPEHRPRRLEAWIEELRSRGASEAKLQRFRENVEALLRWPHATLGEALFSTRTGPVLMPWQWSDFVLGSFPTVGLDAMVDRRLELHGPARLATNEAVWDEAELVKKELPPAVAGLAPIDGDALWEAAVIVADATRPLAAALRADRKRFFPMYEDEQAAIFFRIPIQFRPPDDAQP